jgi:predicted lipoprotein with Yx(FWY)xxD motif
MGNWTSTYEAVTLVQTASPVHQIHVDKAINTALSHGEVFPWSNPFSGLVRTPYSSTFPTLEETDDMEQTKQHRRTTHQVPYGRVAATAFVVGGLSVLVFAVNPAGATTSRTAKRVIVATLNNGQFGKILVSGKTLYTLKSSKTACTAQCTKIWPELVLPKGVTKAKAGSGVSASKLGTVKRKGDVRQVTYSGKALYWFSGDTGPGQVNGNVTDTWGKWSVVVTAKPAHNSAPASSGVTTTPTPSSTPGISATNGNSTTPTTSPSKTTTVTTSPPKTATVTTSPPPATSTTSPPPTTTTTPTTSPPTTTTTAPGSGGGVGF